MPPNLLARALLIAACAGLAGAAPPPPRVKPAPPVAVQIEDTTSDTREAACRAGLAGTAIDHVMLEPLSGRGNCRATAPIEVRALAGGLALDPPATLNCRMTRALGQWAKQSLAPAAAEYLAKRPTGLTVAASYECRSRNRRPGARLSEHAFANALDISAISFAAGPDFEFGARPDATRRAAGFEAAIRLGACALFTTVIGPGGDPSHRHHLHLDLRQRAGGHRLCE